MERKWVKESIFCIIRFLKNHKKAAFWLINLYKILLKIWNKHRFSDSFPFQSCMLLCITVIVQKLQWLIYHTLSGLTLTLLVIWHLYVLKCLSIGAMQHQGRFIWIQNILSLLMLCHKMFKWNILCLNQKLYCLSIENTFLMHYGIERGQIAAVFVPFQSHSASGKDYQWISNKAYVSCLYHNLPWGFCLILRDSNPLKWWVKSLWV